MNTKAAAVVRGLWTLALLMAAYGCGQDAPPAPVSMAMTPLPTSIPTATSSPTPIHTLASIPTPTAPPTATPTPVSTTTQAQSVAPWLPDLFSGGPGGGAASGGDVDAASVEDVLEQGLRLAGASPVHLAFRGTV